jgi:hypothetical protein
MPQLQLGAIFWLFGLSLFVVAAPARSEEPPPSTARVRFESGADSVIVYQLRDEHPPWTLDTWGQSLKVPRRLCASPCRATLTSGPASFQIALAERPENMPLRERTITLPPGDSTASIHYHDRSGLRAFGRVLFVGGMVGSAVYGLVELTQLTSCPREGSCEHRHAMGLGLAGGLMFTSFLLGGVMAGSSDSVDLRVAPRALSREVELPRARQLALRGSF